MTLGEIKEVIFAALKICKLYVQCNWLPGRATVSRSPSALADILVLHV